MDGGPEETAHSGALQAGAMTYPPDLMIALAISHGYSVIREIDLEHAPGAAVGSYVLHLTVASADPLACGRV